MNFQISVATENIRTMMRLQSQTQKAVAGALGWSQASVSNAVNQSRGQYFDREDCRRLERFWGLPEGTLGNARTTRDELQFTAESCRSWQRAGKPPRFWISGFEENVPRTIFEVDSADPLRLRKVQPYPITKRSTAV